MSDERDLRPKANVLAVLRRTGVPEETVQALDAVFAFGQSRDVRIVLEDGIGRGPHVGLEAARLRPVQVAHGGREHEYVSGALERSQD